MRKQRITSDGWTNDGKAYHKSRNVYKSKRYSLVLVEAGCVALCWVVLCCVVGKEEKRKVTKINDQCREDDLET
jgi:hypothetical protein